MTVAREKESALARRSGLNSLHQVFPNRLAVKQGKQEGPETLMTILEDRAGETLPVAEDPLVVRPTPRAPLGTGDNRDRRLDRAMRMIDPAVASSFTAEQRRAIRTMLGLRSDRRTLIDLRGGFELAGRHYFLTLLGGHERRARDGQPVGGLQRLLRDNLLTVILGGLLLVALFGLAAGLRG